MIFLKKTFTAILGGALILSFALSADTWKMAEQKVQKAHRITYPYSDWIETLKEEGVQSVPIFSYGSLMDRSSAKNTLNPETVNTMRPALAYGVMRLFDRDVPIKKGSKWKSPCDPLARGMLNVKPAPSSRYINGILMEVPTSELESILSREEGYDLMPVIVAKWDDKKNYSIAYTFHAPQKSKYTSDKILPRPGYYELSRDAAATISPTFYKLWLESTYLADGQPIAQWEHLVAAHKKQTLVDCYYP